jgi:[acyl-carrier-protein] S-malonyltransferase
MQTDSPMSTAMVFPGMGPSRFEDLAKFLLIHPAARMLAAEADEVLGYSLFDRYREAKGDYSEYAQVAFLVTCLAMARWSEDTLGARPDVCTGPSFGGKAAAAYSGSLTFAQTVRLTAELARREAGYFARQHSDVVTHSFVRTPADRLAGVLQELDERDEWYEVSCYVDDDFAMVSLREGSLEWLQRRLRAVGGLPLYTMRPPMHCAAFGPLREEVERDVFGGIRFADPAIPVVADQDGTVLRSGEGVRTMLLDGIVRPVRWPAVVATLKRLRVERLYVAGPDSMFGRVGCSTRNFDVVAANPRMALQPRRPAMATAAR